MTPKWRIRVYGYSDTVISAPTAADALVIQRMRTESANMVAAQGGRRLGDVVGIEWVEEPTERDVDDRPPHLPIESRRRCQEIARKFYAEATELSDTLLLDVACAAWEACLRERT